MLVRYAIGVALGAIVTFLLFLIMQAVIANDEAKIDKGPSGKLLDMVRLADDEEIQTKQRKLSHHRHRMNRHLICPDRTSIRRMYPRVCISAR